MAALFATVQRHLDARFEPQTALDFGCGVGRVLVPLASRCREVLGLDVSATMLEEARQSCPRHGVENVRLQRSDAIELESLGSFGLVHSFIVFQHIEPSLGCELFERLIACGAPSGVSVCQFAYAAKDKRPRWRRWLRRHRVRLTGLFVSKMETIPYDLNRLFRLLQERGITRVHVELTDHDHYGAILFFRQPHR